MSYTAKYTEAERKIRDRESRLRWYKRNRATILKKLKAYRSKPESKIRHREYARKWRIENPERSREQCNKTRAKHKDKINANRRLKYKTDPEFYLKCIAYDVAYRQSGRRNIVNAAPKMREAAKKRSKEYQKK